MKKGFILYTLIILVVIGTLFWLAFSRSQKSEAPITPLITYTNSSDNLIKVELPFPGAVVGKEFSVIGEARGTWFFEASFPIEVVDKAGKILDTAVAQAGPDPITGEINW